MGQPVKLSDSLILDARLVGEAMERSMASQIEFWARLGRAVERLLEGEQAIRLSKAGTAAPLAASLESVDSPAGRRRLAKHLKGISFPHYEPAPGGRGFLVRIETDGKRTVGRFVNRRFVAEKKRRA
jgi:hypothetical protein